MVCLLDIPGRYLLLTCRPCKRHGRYGLDRLRHRYGDLANVHDVTVTLTQTCRHQQAEGFPTPRYGFRCQVEVDTDEPWRKPTGRSRS